ncbi:hypothetical protein 2204_scaffold14_00058 [Bacteriophage sp.]|nr:hypothetical protein 2204_scaffold14_00058 [Bacteriophage sp.]
MFLGLFPAQSGGRPAFCFEPLQFQDSCLCFRVAGWST